MIRYTLDDPQYVGHAEENGRISKLFNEGLYQALDLSSLYHERWEQSLVFDGQKTHQDPCRTTKPAVFQSETLPCVIQEVYAFSLEHFVIRSLMFRASATVELDSTRTGCRLPCASRSSNAA